MKMEHHELAEFKRDKDGSWLFYDGKLVKAPSPSNAKAPRSAQRSMPLRSGKKFKKCCGV
jgi:uncharacterized protein YchJ